MAVTSNRNLQLEFSGDVTANLIQKAVENAASPGMMTVVELADGNNTITAPDVEDVVVTALTILMPSANEVQVTLKGVAGDTGILLNLVDPSVIALSEDFVSLVLHADGEAIPGVRLIWS